MAQTGNVKWCITAGIPNVTATGNVKWFICAGIPSAYTAPAAGGWTTGSLGGTPNANIGEVGDTPIEDIGKIGGT